MARVLVLGGILGGCVLVVLVEGMLVLLGRVLVIFVEVVLVLPGSVFVVLVVDGVEVEGSLVVHVGGLGSCQVIIVLHLRQLVRPGALRGQVVEYLGGGSRGGGRCLGGGR